MVSWKSNRQEKMKKAVWYNTVITPEMKRTIGDKSQTALDSSSGKTLSTLFQYSSMITQGKS